MKDTKKERRFFTIAEWDKEEEYLRKRHLEGWKFTYLVIPGIYHFEKCEPEDVVYQLDYNEEGLKNMSRCFGTADGNICRIMPDTAIFASRSLRWRGKKKLFSVTMSRVLRCCGVS